jgi:hypothetical protein
MPGFIRMIWLGTRPSPPPAKSGQTRRADDALSSSQRFQDDCKEGGQGSGAAVGSVSVML